MRLLLLDANIIIKLFELGFWDDILNAYDIHLSRTVIGEAEFYCDEYGTKHNINLSQEEDEGKLSVFEVDISDIKEFTDRFDATYLEKLDPGEAESLANIMQKGENYSICSADHIVYKVLGNLLVTEKGVSLDEILNETGLYCELPRCYSEAFRLSCSMEGTDDRMLGLGIIETKFT